MVGNSWIWGIFLIFLFTVLSCQESIDVKQNEMIFVEGGNFKWHDSTYLIKNLLADKYEVTVAEFAKFIETTGYVTTADSIGWSGVFDLKLQKWIPIDGANWEYPKGRKKRKAKSNEPVTQISWLDANAFSKWKGKRLPSMIEWLYVASSKGIHKSYPFEEENLMGPDFHGNWWQGNFPFENTKEDGFNEIAPVGSFKPTTLGFYDVAGNVWEWTTDFLNENEEGKNRNMIIMGGSFLCDYKYCRGFNFNGFQFSPKDSGLNHLGFRCVKDVF